MTPVLTISDGNSAQAIADLLRVCFPDARTVLDMTYGSGKFWSPTAPVQVEVTGLDLDPRRARDQVGDFTALPYVDNSFGVAIFDPPYHTDMGRANPSVMGTQFGHYPTLLDLECAVTRGVVEAARVSALGYIVKCQDYIHGQRAIWMSEWVRRAAGQEPYDFLITRQPNKLVDPKWVHQFSVWRNHAVYWVFRHGDQRHRQRSPR